MPVTILASPYTTVTNASIRAGIAAFFAADAAIGETVRVSRLREAISQAGGETWHIMSAPGADVAMAAFELPVPGVIAVGSA